MTNKNRYSPTPWRVAYSSARDYHWIKSTNTDHIIARMDQNVIDYDFETMLYDANLMACSPELLEKLAWITDEYVNTLVGYNITNRIVAESITKDIKLLISNARGDMVRDSIARANGEL